MEARAAVAADLEQRLRVMMQEPPSLANINSFLLLAADAGAVELLPPDDEALLRLHMASMAINCGIMEMNARLCRENHTFWPHTFDGLQRVR